MIIKESFYQRQIFIGYKTDIVFAWTNTDF